MDGDKAPRDTPVNMIYDVNAEELIVIVNKRLCMKASAATRNAVNRMCNLAILNTPEIAEQLVPMCAYTGKCHEMQPCGHCKEIIEAYGGEYGRS